MEGDVIIRAIDVGFGNTKHTLGHSQIGGIECAFFPSIAPHAQSSGQLDVECNIYNKHNVVNVQVGGVTRANAFNWHRPCRI